MSTPTAEAATYQRMRAHLSYLKLRAAADVLGRQTHCHTDYFATVTTAAGQGDVC
jgi:hypothetical protein